MKEASSAGCKLAVSIGIAKGIATKLYTQIKAFKQYRTAIEAA